MTTCCGRSLAIAYGTPNVPIGGFLSSVGKELERAAKRVGKEVERSAKKVGSEVSRVSDRISAEYGRLGRRAEAAAERVGKQIGGEYERLGSRAWDMVRDAARWVRENPAVVGTVGAILVPLGGWYLVVGASLAAYASFSAAGFVAPWDAPGAAGDGGADWVASSGVGSNRAAGMPTLATWAIVGAGLLLLWLLLR